jgi:hypothetical protein
MFRLIKINTMSKNIKPIKLVKREESGPLLEMTDEQLQRIGELALQL